MKGGEQRGRERGRRSEEKVRRRRERERESGSERAFSAEVSRGSCALCVVSAGLLQVVRCWMDWKRKRRGWLWLPLTHSLTQGNKRALRSGSGRLQAATMTTVKGLEFADAGSLRDCAII